jgi:hypothetical protein
VPAVVVYESMFGNTRKVAEAIARGLAEFGEPGEVVALPVSRADAAALARFDLIVVGGPTHMHTLSRPFSRRMAARIAEKPGSGVTLEWNSGAPGLREWFARLGRLDARCAAFDTRGAGLATFTGRAAKRIHRELRRHGARPVQRPRSFVMGAHNVLAAGELRRAEAWGAELRRATQSSAHA